MDRFAGNMTGARRAGIASVRRPLRGLEIKEDTYAVLKVVKADGSEVPVADSATFKGTGVNYANFLLQQVTETRIEKQQLIETFGAAYVFFYGEQPRFLDVAALLMNSADFNWAAEWWYNYENFWRGTKLAEMGARVYLLYDDNIVEGYMMSSAATRVSAEQHIIQLQCRLFVTQVRSIAVVGDPNYPLPAATYIPEGVDLRDPASNRLLDYLAATPDYEQLQQEAAIIAPRPDQFASYGTLADLVRRGLISAPGSSPDIESFVRNAAAAVYSDGYVLSEDEKRWLPLRSRYVDNVDEWTGAPPFEDVNIGDVPEVDDVVKTLDGAFDDFDLPKATPKQYKEMGVIPPPDDPPDEEDEDDKNKGVGMGPPIIIERDPPKGDDWPPDEQKNPTPFGLGSIDPKGKILPCP